MITYVLLLSCLLLGNGCCVRVDRENVYAFSNGDLPNEEVIEVHMVRRILRKDQAHLIAVDGLADPDPRRQELDGATADAPHGAAFRIATNGLGRQLDVALAIHLRRHLHIERFMGTLRVELDAPLLASGLLLLQRRRRLVFQVEPHVDVHALVGPVDLADTPADCGALRCLARPTMLTDD